MKEFTFTMGVSPGSNNQQKGQQSLSDPSDLFEGTAEKTQSPAQPLEQTQEVIPAVSLPDPDQATLGQSQGMGRETKVMVSTKGSVLELSLMTFFVVCLILTSLIGILGFVYFVQDHAQYQEEVKGVSTPVDTAVSTDESPDHVLIYTDGNNIYQIHNDQKDQTQLTHFENEGILGGLSGTDIHNVGFFYCTKTEDDCGCTIYSADIEQRVLLPVKKLRSTQCITQLAWIDSQKYAYSVMNLEGTVWSTHYVKDESISEIAYARIEDRVERRQFIEDSSCLYFSPEQDKLLHIDTQARGGADFRVFVYDLQGTLLDTIEDATMPVWKDNQTIIYRRYANDNAGFLYERNIGTQQSVQLISQKAVYDPLVQTDYLVYWDMNGGAYIYDFQRKRSELLASDAAYPIWISDQEVAFAHTRRCKKDECEEIWSREFETQFQIEYFVKKDLSTDEIDKLSIKQGISPYRVVNLHTDS